MKGYKLSSLVDHHKNSRKLVTILLPMIVSSEKLVYSYRGGRMDHGITVVKDLVRSQLSWSSQTHGSLSICWRVER
jgi:hypothetical protein